MVDIENEDFDDEFSTFGFAVEEDEIYDKLRQLCQLHRLDVEGIVCEWLAFVQTKQNAKLNISNLEQMDRDKLSKKQAKTAKTPKNNQMKTLPFNKSQNLTTVVDDVLESYTTPSKGTNKRQHTPDNPVNKRFTGGGRNPIPFSPASFSPSQGATPSKKYSNRADAGKVVCSWGTDNNMQWKSQRETPVDTKLHTCEDYSSSKLMSKFKYMFQKLSDKSSVLNEMVEEMGEFLKKQNNLNEEFSHVSLPSQESVTVVGRVCCDTVGKLNAKSVMLEGSRETSGGHMIALDLSEIPQFSLFPGQVITANGLNSTGSKFVVKKLHEGACLPLPENMPNLNQGPLSFVVAVGPYTTSDSVMYEPLGDLVKYLHKETPDVCIMMGPFIDSKQADIEESMTDMTFDQFFEKKIIEVLAEATSRLKTRLIFVPSYRDVHHEYIYPQPPFTINADVKNTLGSDLKSKKIQFMSDPCTLYVDGVVIGITSTDVLFHLGQEETSSSTGGDRLARLTQHLLSQHNYYPLHPPNEDVNIDYDHYDLHARLPCTPHIFIVPSDLRYFIKDIQGCCCLNPGRLAKGQIGGTFARFVVNPQNTPHNNSSSSKSITNQISAQVLRI